MKEKLVHDGQVYTVVSERSYQRKDGQMTTLVTWQSHCPNCGSPFEFECGKNGGLKHIQRRCNRHKSPGKPVSVAGAFRQARYRFQNQGKPHTKGEAHDDHGTAQ